MGGLRDVSRGFNWRWRDGVESIVGEMRCHGGPDRWYWLVDWNGRLAFFPAYRPRVMMATRPTLRTRISPSITTSSNTSHCCMLTLHCWCRRFDVAMYDVRPQFVKFLVCDQNDASRDSPIKRRVTSSGGDVTSLLALFTLMIHVYIVV